MSDENNITTTHDLQLAACLAAAEGITDEVSPELESVARQKIVALRKRCEELSAALDQISAALYRYYEGLEPGTFGWFVSDVVARVAPRLASDAAALDRISTAIDEYRPSLEPGTFGRFVADTVAGAAPRLVSDVAMSAEPTSGNVD